MKANGLIVFVPKYGIEGPVYLTPRADGNSNSGPSSSSNNKAVAESAFVLDEKKQTVVSRCARQELRASVSLSFPACQKSRNAWLGQREKDLLQLSCLWW